MAAFSVRFMTSPYSASTDAVSMSIPGPIVEEIDTVRKYLPLAAGFAAAPPNEGGRVFLELAFVERRLADRRVDDRGLVDAKLDLTGLDLADRLGDVHRDRAGLRIRHEPLWAQDFSELADEAHHVRRRHERVEIQEAALDLLHEILRADVICARVRGFFPLVAAGDDGDALGRAGAVREDDRAADHLVRMLRIDSEEHRDVHRFVELRELHVSDELHRFAERVRARFDLRFGGQKLLPCFTH